VTFDFCYPKTTDMGDAVEVRNIASDLFERVTQFLSPMSHRIFVLVSVVLPQSCRTSDGIVSTNRPRSPSET